MATTITITASPPAALPGTPEASAKPTNSMPSGPAAQAILRWFTTDRSLGCSDQQLDNSACTIGLNMLYGGVTVYYGNSTGDGPQADALAFLYYDQDPTQNGTNLAIAYFHRDGGNYRFIKTFPDITGDMMQSTPDDIVKGATVQFLPGKARFSMVVHRDTDALCCPTGRANYTVTLNPAHVPRAARPPLRERRRSREPFGPLTDVGSFPLLNAYKTESVSSIFRTASSRSMAKELASAAS